VLCRASYKVILGQKFFAWLFQWLIYREDGQVYVACGGPPPASSWSQMTNSGVRDRKEEKSSPKKITVHHPSPPSPICLSVCLFFPLSPEQKKIVWRISQRNELHVLRFVSYRFFALLVKILLDQLSSKPPPFHLALPLFFNRRICVGKSLESRYYSFTDSVVNPEWFSQDPERPERIGSGSYPLQQDK